ncbi:MAG: hypothetical protein ACLRYB_09415 [Segatella copri]
MEIGKMEALGEEAGWKRKDEGGQAMESLGTGAREERLGAREERLEAKERVENRKEKRSFFIKSCTKKERNLDFCYE